MNLILRVTEIIPYLYVIKLINYFYLLKLDIIDNFS